MTWVTTTPETATLANILSSHSLNPEALEAHVRLYRTIGPEELRPGLATEHASALCLAVV
jgi:hypothetical protein